MLALRDDGDDFSSLGRDSAASSSRATRPRSGARLQSSSSRSSRVEHGHRIDAVVVVTHWTPPEARRREEPRNAATETLMDGLVSGLRQSQECPSSAWADDRGRVGARRLPRPGDLERRRHRRLRRAAWRSRSSSRAATPATTASVTAATDGVVPPIEPSRPRVSSSAEVLTILVAARNEEERIGETVAALRATSATPRSSSSTGAPTTGRPSGAEAAGAVVLRIERLGKGEALSAGERIAAPGPLLLATRTCAARCARSPTARPTSRVAAFARRVGGGLGIAKRVGARARPPADRLAPREPLSGQRLVGERARAACFPLAPGFGCEVRMTIDALAGRADVGGGRARPRPPGRRAVTRPASLHRGRQLLDAVLAAGPLAVNHRGQRLPLVGWTDGCADRPARQRRRSSSASSTTRLERRRAGLPGPPLVASARPESSSSSASRSSACCVRGACRGALLVAGSANLFNQLDTRPGRGAKGLRSSPPSRSTRRSAWPSCSFPTISGEGDAGGCGIECAWGHARLEVRGPLPRMGSLGRDRERSLASTSSVSAVARRADRAHARPCGTRPLGRRV